MVIQLKRNTPIRGSCLLYEKDERIIWSGVIAPVNCLQVNEFPYSRLFTAWDHDHGDQPLNTLLGSLHLGRSEEHTKHSELVTFTVYNELLGHDKGRCHLTCPTRLGYCGKILWFRIYSAHGAYKLSSIHDSLKPRPGITQYVPTIQFT